MLKDVWQRAEKTSKLCKSCGGECQMYQCSRATDILERVQEWAQKSWRNWNISPLRRGLESWGCSAQGDPISVYKYLQGRCKEGRARLCSVMPSDRAGGNKHKLKHGKFSLNIRTPFHCVGDWALTGFPVVVSLHPWRYSKATWTQSQVCSSGCPCCSRGIGQMTPRGPFHPQSQQSCDSLASSEAQWGRW